MRISRFADPTGTVYRFLIALLIYMIGGFPTLVYALPQGGTIASGAGTIDTSGSALTVTQTTNKIIINWESFSIGNNESVIFLQPDSSSSALNNVLGTSRTVVEGNLLANGQIVLSNPNGIFLSPNANIDVAGLIASTLKISEQDFLDGLYKFSQDSSKPLASILNEGKIRASDFAALIAPSVDNKGVVIANLGTVGLVSGKAATVDFVGDNLIKFTVNAPVEGQVLDKNGNLISDRISNSGSIQANGGQVILSAKNASSIIQDVINVEGLITAKTVTKKNGLIVISGGNQGNVNVAGTLDASGEKPGDQGGEITIEGATVTTYNASIQAEGTDAKGGDINITGTNWVSATGTIDVSGETGGNVNITTGDLDISAPILAKGTTGQGGNININTLFMSWEVVSAMLDVSGASGGSIKHFADQQIVTSGKYLAIGTDGKGGSIDVTANALKFMSNTIDASGTMGGGRIRLGGEYQGGKNLTIDEIKNAQTLVMTDTANITAKTMGTDGDGGRIIAWADQGGVVLGQFDTTPGTQTGAGGFVEVSSGDVLNFRGNVRTGIGDRLGTLLLDPKNITISTAEVYSQSSLLMGFGYTGHSDSSIDDFDETTLDSTDDLYGFSVSLDGNRLAVGTPFGSLLEESSGSDYYRNGAVFLYSFDDSSFSNATLQNIVGRGRSINHYNNRADQFGTSVSLDTASDGSARLAVGARNSDGMQTNTSLHSSGNRGTVYLFSFTGISANNNSFAGGELKAIIGEGFTTSRVQDTGNAKFFDRDGFFVGKDASPPNGLDISSHIGTDDNFGQGVSLDGTMLAVGAQGDDVSGTSGEGAAYLFNFASGSTSATSFESPTLVGKIGDGYSIANTSLSAGMDETALEASDAFGHELSLDAIYNSSGVVTSARLAVVAKSDDGSGNGNADSGAVYLYTFSDSSFSNATKVGTIGDGYSGATLTVASSTDALTAGRTITGGTSGATGVVVTGAANSTTVTYTVTSGTFVKDERITEATSNYTRDVLANSKDIDITIDEDNVVSSVSLDGTNLAFGIADGDGSGNAENVSGEVYNFSFTDNAFLDGVLEGRMGYGYSKDNSPANYDAAKNRDQEPSHALIITEFEPEALTYTEFADQGGGTTLVSASVNHTLSTGDTVTISGTTNYNGTFVITKSTSKKFIISETFVADDATGSSSFTKITVEQLGVGNNLGHGKIASGQVVISGTTNYDGTYTIATIDGSDALWINKAFVADDATGIARASSIQSQDRFGQGVSIDNGRLVVGAAQGNNFSGNKVQSGEVYLFPVYADDGTDNARLFSTNPSADHTISPSTLATLLSNPTDVTLQASNDIGIFEEVDVANASGDGGHLTLQAGRSILINANITTDNGNLTLTANDTTDNGVVDAQRDSGNAAITMTTGAEINVGTGTLTATISDDTSKTNSATGDIQLFSVTAATMNVTNSGATDDSNIIDDNNNDEAFTISGVSTFTATGDGDITLNNTSGHAFSGAVRLNTGTGNAVVVDTSGLDLGLSTVGGTLSATAVLGDIVDSDTLNTSLTITGVATFTTKADDSDIILDSTDNTFAAAVKMVADDGSEDFENITFVDSAAVDFDASVSANGDLWIDAGTDHQVTGNLIVTAGGNITQNVALAVTGTSSFTTNNTDGTITLSGTNALAGTVSLNTEGSSGNATLDNGTTALDLATSTVGGNLAVTAGNDITDCNGCILTVGGTSSFAADVNDKTITLSENHAFTEAISFTTTDNETGTANDADVSVTGISGTALKLGASTVKGDLTITTSNAGGATNTAISDEGVLTIHGNSTFTSTATDAAIDLDSANLFTGWVKLATATGGDATITTGGQALEFNTSTVGRHLSVTSAAAITQSGVLTVTGTTTITADNSGTKQDVSLEDLTTGGDAQNQFSGAVSVTGNWVKLGTANGVILGDITTADANGHFTLDPNQSGGNTGSVTQAAGTALDIYQKTIITATGIDVLLTSATNDMTRVGGAQIRVDGTNVEIVDIDNIELGTITATGFLNVTAGGAVTNSSSTGALTITGATTIQAKSGSTYYDVTLDHTSSDFATIKVTGANVILVDANAIVLGASTVTGTYAVTATAGGDITQATDEALRITGAATFTAAGGQSIILGNSNTFDDTSNAGATDANVTFAAVSGNLKNVTIKDSDEFELRALTLAKVSSAGGELTVTTGGALTDGGALVIPGTTTITATGQSVVLDTTSNDFATILFGSSGNAVLSVEVEDTNAIVIGTSHSTGDFKVTAGGNITDDGTITVAASDATLYAITDANNGDITLNQLAVAGFIDLATNDAANNDTGHATIVNTTDVKLAASTVEGDLSATATTGNITQTGALTIKGTSTLVTSAEDADITLTETSNAFAGALLITTNDNTDGADNIYTADVEIDNGSTALVMGLSTIDGDLSLLSGGTLTDTGIATVRGNLTATTDASSSAITLNQLAVGGSFTLAPNSSGAVIIVNDAGLDLALSTMGGTFNGTATTGNITQSGTLTITGAATFITGVDGSNIILDASGNAFSAAVKMKADGGGTEDFGNITFVDSAGINFATSAGSNGDLYIDSSADGKVGGSLIVTATTGNITNAAALQVATTSSFTTSADDATITLSAPAVALTGAVTLSTSGSSGHATIDNGTTILKIAESTVGGNLTLTSGASTSGSDYAIMDTGTLTVSGNLIATTDDNNGVIDLGSLAVNGSFDLTTDGSGNATVINATGLEFIASGIGGNLSATATTGNITQKTGALTVGGTTTLVTTAQGANIDLLSTITSNAFTGELLITTNDNDSPADSTYEAHVKIDGGTTNLIIGTSTIDGDLTLLSGGTITDTNSSTVTIKGDLSATTDANSSDITLNDLAVSGQIQLDTVIVSNEDTAQAGSTGTTIKLATGASTTDDFYNSMSVYIASGVGAGQVRDISDYVGSTRVATVATWTTTPDATSVYEVRSSFGDATVVNATDITFAASTVGGNLTATATTEDVTQSGAINIAGISTITASASGADVILFNPLNDFVGAVSTTGHDVKLWDTNAIDLGAATVAGVYTVYAGTTIEDSGAQVVTGLSYIYTHDDASQITLDHASNSFGKTVDYQGGIGFTVVDSDATGFILVGRTLLGNLHVTAAGPVTQNGTQIIGGTTTIIATGQNVTLTDVSNDFKNAVIIKGEDVEVVDGVATTIGGNSIGIDLGASTVSGTYKVTATAGNIIDSGNLVIEEIATVLASTSSDQDITLNSNNNFKEGIRLEGRNVEVRVASSANLILGAASGTSTITGWLKGLGVGNAVTDGGALSVVGTTRITATGQDVTLDSEANGTAHTNNFQGLLKIKGANVSVTHPTALKLGDSTISGTYDIRTTTGNITDGSGETLTVDRASSFTTDADGADIKLDTTTNGFTGDVTVNTVGVGGDAEIHGGSTALGIIASSEVGTLKLTTAGANITDSGSLVVIGATTIDAGSANITLDDGSSNLQGAVGASGKVVKLTHNRSTGIKLGDSTVTQTYTVTATTGDITDTGNLTITGLTTLVTSADGADIILDGTGHTFTGNVKVTTNEISTNADAHATIDGGSSVGLKIEKGSEVQGDLTLRSGHANTITDEGDSGVVTVDGNLTATTYANNGSITLNDLAVDGTIGLNTHGTGDATVVNDAGFQFASSTVGGNLHATSTTGNMTQNGALDIEGTTTLITSVDDATINLGTSSNAFTGALLITTNDSGSDTAGDVSIHGGTTALVLGASTIDGDLTLTSTATGDAGITNNGTLNIRGTTTVSASGVDVTLNSAANNFQGAVAIDGVNVTVVDADNIMLAASTVTGNYTLTAGGLVEDDNSGALTITGVTTIDAGGNVVLDIATNNFQDAVKIVGVNVTVVDAGVIELGTSTVTGTYAVTATAGGDITNTGVLTITGAATFKAESGQSIYLNESNTFSSTVAFTTPSGNLANVTVRDTTNFDLVALTLSGDLVVTSTGGSITDDGVLAISGTSSFTTSANNKFITLDVTTNAFTRAVTLNTTGSLGHAEIDGGTTQLIIAASTVGGDLELTSGNATGITDSGTVTVNGNLIVINDVSNGDINMGSLAVDGTIALVTTGSGGDVTVVNDAGLDFVTSSIGGDLTATATSGNISDSGTLTVTGATNIYLGTNPILSVSGATSATDINGNTITLNISVFTGGITLHYDNVLPPDDNSDIYLASQVAFAELLFSIDQNITKIYGSYEETQDHLLWMYKLFRDSFPMQEQFLEVDRQPQPNQVKLRKIKTNIKKNNASEGKRL